MKNLTILAALVFCLGTTAKADSFEYECQGQFNIPVHLTITERTERELAESEDGYRYKAKFSTWRSDERTSTIRAATYELLGQTGISRKIDETTGKNLIQWELIDWGNFYHQLVVYFKKNEATTVNSKAELIEINIDDSPRTYTNCVLSKYSR